MASSNVSISLYLYYPWPMVVCRNDMCSPPMMECSPHQMHHPSPLFRPPPPSDSTDWADFMDPQEVRKPLWSSNSYPHLAYVPATIRFYGPLFLTLATNASTMPVANNGAVWQFFPLVAAT